MEEGAFEGGGCMGGGCGREDAVWERGGMGGEGHSGGTCMADTHILVGRLGEAIPVFSQVRVEEGASLG